MLAVRSLMYTQVCMRPNTAYVTGMLSRYLRNLGVNHWKAIKSIVQYLQKTEDYMLIYQRLDKLKIIRYTNSDFAEY